MKRSNIGFTLVEWMIVVVIIGLLAAMAIPAFQKVREASIMKAGDRGDVQGWDASTWELYRKAKASQVAAGRPERSSEMPASSFLTGYSRLTIEGKSYILIPKGEVGETKVGSQVFVLVPDRQ